MTGVSLKLVTIVAEAVLEERLARALLSLGAKGYTLSEVRGRGARGVRAGEPDVNVKIEAVVTPEVADRILAHLAERYFADYAVIAYVETVTVVRGEKYA
jgi:nitrogen regulatory protein PII